MAKAARWAAYLRFCLLQEGLSQPCDILSAMTEDPDFRSDKSESTEGGRVAVAPLGRLPPQPRRGRHRPGLLHAGPEHGGPRPRDP